MSSERAFLEQLAAGPGDDVTRLVYADWLEDHGDPRAGFLRRQFASFGEVEIRDAVR